MLSTPQIEPLTSPNPDESLPLVLAADDEPDILQLVSCALKGGGFRVATALDGVMALQIARERRPSFAVLDLLLPGLTGLEVCRMLKGDPETAALPILILTARGTEDDRISAFERGADDLLTKPFSPRELVLRIKAILRGAATARETGQALTVGLISLDREQHLVAVGRRRINVTETEYRLLSALMEGAGRVQSREVLLQYGWDASANVEVRTVDTLIRRLRAKLAEASDQLQTVRGFGYRLVGYSPAGPC